MPDDCPLPVTTHLCQKHARGASAAPSRSRPGCRRDQVLLVALDVTDLVRLEHASSLTTNAMNTRSCAPEPTILFGDNVDDICTDFSGEFT